MIYKSQADQKGHIEKEFNKQVHQKRQIDIEIGQNTLCPILEICIQALTVSFIFDEKHDEHHIPDHHQKLIFSDDSIKATFSVLAPDQTD